MPGDFVIRTITIDDEGLSVEYVQPAVDIKVNKVQHNHVLFVPRDDDYDEEIAAVEDAGLYLLRDVLEDLPLLKGLRERPRRSRDLLAPPEPDPADRDDPDDDDDDDDDDDEDEN